MQAQQVGVVQDIISGQIQTFAVVLDDSLPDLLEVFGFVVTKATPGSEFLMVTLPRIAALLPFILLVLILVLRPRGLLGTRDT
jgi:branched-chain amino acid transport system permease protein